MKYSQTKYLRGLGCLLISGLIVSSGSLHAEDSFTFKRVKVKEKPLGSRIDIQIKPEESFYHVNPTVNKPKPIETKKDTTVIAATPSNHYDWFWSDFSHDLTGASLTRLNDAERQLLKSPEKSRGLAPSLKSMRELAKTYGAEILVATLDKDVSPALVLAVMGVESAGKPNAVSSAGAVGLMQLIPDTAKRFNVKDSTDPKQNIAGGVAYLDWLIKEFKRDPVLALAGYNAGENAVKEHNGVPPFAETRGYIPKVVAAWKVAKALCQTPPKYATDGCVFDFNPKISQQ